MTTDPDALVIEVYLLPATMNWKVRVVDRLNRSHLYQHNAFDTREEALAFARRLRDAEIEEID